MVGSGFLDEDAIDVESNGELFFMVLNLFEEIMEYKHWG